MNKKIYDIMNMSIQMAFIGFLFFNFDFGFGGNWHRMFRFSFGKNFDRTLLI